MAGVAAPSQAPPAARAAAWASALRRAVVAAVVFGFLAFAWLSSAANAVFVAAHWAYGEGSPVAAATKDAALAFSVLTGLLLHALVLVFLSLLCCRGNRQAAGNGEIGVARVGTGGAERPRAPEIAGGRGQEDEVHGAVVVCIVVVSMVLGLTAVVLLIQVLATGKRPRIGFMIIDLVFVFSFVTFCFVTTPAFVIRVVIRCAEERGTAGVRS
ncbi:hypothetical protein ACP70R_000779 [Stipagrostis hirtigluma subsp. patula]